MIIPIRCFTCGKVVADKYDYYVREVEKRKSQKKKEPADAPFFDEIHSKEILDELGLKRICCRRMMLGTEDMTDKI